MQRLKNQVGIGHLIAEFLSGVWRHKLPEYEISEDALAFINPSLQGSGAGGLAWRRVSQSPLQRAQIGIQLQQVFRLQTLHAARHELDIQKLFKLLRQTGLEPMLVKGWAIARVYPAKGLRPYGDIDLIVHPKEMAKAAEMIGSPEGKKYYVDFVHEELDKIDEHLIDKLFANSQLVKLGDIDVRVMGEEDHLRFLCIHLLRHGAWRPLWLCDIALAVESRKADFDWQRCLGHDRHQADWVLSTMRLAHELLGAELSNTPAENKKLPKWLVPTVLKQWEKPCSADHEPPELIMTSLRHPRQIVKAIRDRWSDPISSSIRMHALFNELPRLPFQVANYLIGLTRFAGRLPKLLARK